ncbi:hypothetical protein K505DRAFT_161995 [Melanomma pulvis-pyrius CBS 109.77]|uniref:Uncharacterized protein n=1 Tax=Melanomma pulvis-pyrius CBS 109.77 TaxID=1314802 RepID=A0A6A6XLN2_9PLEO|nr:hypothetical protein K505DRAFT_161995 [Melanomma pulvis-pyrius CBS 109.77]
MMWYARKPNVGEILNPTADAFTLEDSIQLEVDEESRYAETITEPGSFRSPGALVMPTSELSLVSPTTASTSSTPTGRPKSDGSLFLPKVHNAAHLGQDTSESVAPDDSSQASPKTAQSSKIKTDPPPLDLGDTRISVEKSALTEGADAAKGKERIDSTVNSGQKSEEL